jgi:serine/threonine-protein kinase RsbW
MGVSTRAEVEEQCSAAEGSAWRVLFERAIPSSDHFVRPMVFCAVEFLIREELVESSLRERYQMVLTEALRNAVHHGNRGQYARSVGLRIFSGPKEWGVLVEDEGRGFDPERIGLPAGDDGIWGESGRGVGILRHYMDRVEFHEGGSALLLVKRRGSGKE